MKNFTMFGVEVSVDDFSAQHKVGWYVIEWAGCDSIALFGQIDRVCEIAATLAAPNALHSVNVYADVDNTFKAVDMWSVQFILEGAINDAPNFELFTYNPYFALEIASLFTKNNFCGRKHKAFVGKRNQVRHIVVNGCVEKTFDENRLLIADWLES